MAAYDDPLMIVNLSVWTDVESLRAYVYETGHIEFLRRRRRWFAAPAGEHLVCWWIREGTLPTVADAVRRLEQLGRRGPSAEGFRLSKPLPPPA